VFYASSSKINKKNSILLSTCSRSLLFRTKKNVAQSNRHTRKKKKDFVITAL
jgi:hypothetical protein